MEALCNGASVSFGLGSFGIKVNGVFTGDNAQWDSAKHSLAVRFMPNAELRKSIKAANVNVRGLAISGTVINSVTDVTSGEENSKLTPGGGINISGTRIRIEGDAPGVGLKLVNIATEEETSIPVTSILTNAPSKITCIVPANLPEGDYRMLLTTQHGGTGAQLKTPRRYKFEYILSV